MNRNKNRGFSRVERINEAIKRELSFIIRDESNDPRIGRVTISAVDTTKDISIAKVFITVLESEKKEQTIKVLNSAAGFFRSELAKKLKLRTTPRLIFVYDESLEIGNKIGNLLDSLNISKEDDSSDLDNKD